MPTARRRHILTETEALRAALDVAGHRWPDDRERPSRLVLRLVEEGRRSLVEGDLQATDRRRVAIETTSGALTGAYGPDYLERLREDWPR